MPVIQHHRRCDTHDAPMYTYDCLPPDSKDPICTLRGPRLRWNHEPLPELCPPPPPPHPTWIMTCLPQSPPAFLAARARRGDGASYSAPSRARASRRHTRCRTLRPPVSDERVRYWSSGPAAQAAEEEGEKGAGEARGGEGRADKRRKAQSGSPTPGMRPWQPTASARAQRMQSGAQNRMRARRRSRWHGTALGGGRW